MVGKTYIVANKEQELEVLNKLEQEGVKWPSGRKPTEFFPGNTHPFPLLLCESDWITWDYLDNLKNEEIVYDGRKEETADKKHRVTQKFMDELNEWKQANFNDDFMMVEEDAIADFSEVINGWWYSVSNDRERNERLITIIQWLNGEDVFEVEKPHKFVVRNKEIHSDGYYSYVKVFDQMTLHTDYKHAMKFDTREEAQEWANSHQVVVEIDEEGNEVE